jgi:hypothetical protein
VAPHDFRRTFISALLSNGVDMLTVQRMAGHSDPRTTSGYDLRLESEMRAATALLHLPYHQSARVVLSIRRRPRRGERLQYRNRWCAICSLANPLPRRARGDSAPNRLSPCAPKQNNGPPSGLAVKPPTAPHRL